MIQKKRRFAWLVALFALLSLSAAACGDSGGDEADAGSRGGEATETEATAAVAEVSGSIEGAGASFPDAFYQEAIGGLADVAPDLTVTYNAIGSSSGKEEFAQDLNDFAGSDSLVDDDEGIDPGSFHYIPSTAASIAVVYNLPDVEELNLDGPTVAKIFEREITNWDDPAIAATNEGVELPDLEITVARRSDGSGTTKNFTKYLESAAPDDWTLGSDDTVEWPSDTQGGQQNPGVAQIVTDTEGGIGYVDFGNASKLDLQMANIGNAEGNFVSPSIDATQAALARAPGAPAT